MVIIITCRNLDVNQLLPLLPLLPSKSHIPTEMNNDNGVSSNIDEQMKEGVMWM